MELLQQNSAEQETDSGSEDEHSLDYSRTDTMLRPASQADMIVEQ
jgi:hypothetical protein